MTRLRAHSRAKTRRGRRPRAGAASAARLRAAAPLAALVLLLVLAAAFALAACGTDAGGSGSAVASPAATSVATTAASPSVAAATPTPTPTPTPPPLDKPTKSDPMRIYFGGDSLSGMPGMMLQIMTAKSGLARVNPDYVESSRLTYTEPVDWPAHLSQQMHAAKYDVGVFMIGANDSGMPMIAGGSSVMYPNKKWLKEYESRAKKIAALMLHSGVKRVYWVGMPVMPDSGESAKMRALNKVFEDVASSSPDIVYVDSYDLLSKKSGGWNPSVRSADGVHYTDAGATIVAKAVWAAIKKDWQKQ